MCKKQKAGYKIFKNGSSTKLKKKRSSSKLSWILKTQHLLILIGSHIFSLSLILSKMYRLVSRLVQTCLDLSRHVLTLYYYCDLNKHRKKIVHHWNSGKSWTSSCVSSTSIIISPDIRKKVWII